MDQDPKERLLLPPRAAANGPHCRCKPAAPGSVGVGGGGGGGGGVAIDVHGLKKRGGGRRSWVRVDAATGASEAVEVAKPALMRRLDLPARDLRLLDPLFVYPSAILGRERAVVCNLERIWCIITADDALVLRDPDADGGAAAEAAVRMYVDELQRRLVDRADDLPFEFIALEVALEAACSFLDTQAVELETEAYPLLDELTAKISTLDLERARRLKSKLVALTRRVQKVRDEIEQLMDDDGDMAEMYLTEKKRKMEASLLDEQGLQGIGSNVFGPSFSAPVSPASSPPAPRQLEKQFSFARSRHDSFKSSESSQYNIEELEMLLEAYFVVIDYTLNKLTSSSTMATAHDVGHVEAEMDPMLDPRRRPARAKDPGWKYGYWTEPPNRDAVTCNLCKRKLTGGITRLKEHLAGSYGDTLICLKTTTPIRLELESALQKGRRMKRPLDIDGGEQDVVEVATATATSAACPKPSSGTATKKNKSSFVASARGKGTNTNQQAITAMFRKKPSDVVDERRSGCSQSTMESSSKTKEDRTAVSKEWCLWFAEAKIPFNAASLRQFEIAIEASCQYGSGYKPPTPHELSGPLLDQLVVDTRTLRQRHEEAWKHYGCTLMSDGWTDRRGRHLINFLVNSPEGTYFLESIDASDESHSAALIADLLQERIEGVGKEKVVQVVTDNGANYKAAGKILMERYPTLYWSPCAAHCLDLMLEGIGRLKEFRTCIARAKRVTTFIYRHGRILRMMRDVCKNDLVRAGATRFATNFLTLKSLHLNKNALRCLFVSPEWLVKSKKLATSVAGMDVHDTVLSTEFWNSVLDCLRASAHLLIVLRVVDGDVKPAMAEVAALMAFAKEKLKQGFCTDNKQSLLRKILAIIDKRWVKQMDHPLYGAALFLNQGKFYPIMSRGDDEMVGELRSCFNDVLGKMVEDDVLRNKIDQQAVLYENQRGPFSSVMAMQNVGTRSPLDWWQSYGGRTIDLQRFAKRLVSFCASSSGCERNWSVFEGIHTKKRNRLQHKKMNDCAFVSYNQQMASRFKKRRENAGKKDYDPLIIEEFDWDNDWVDPSVELPQGVRGIVRSLWNDLTWDNVDEAVGATHSLQGRHLPRAAHIQQGSTFERGSSSSVGHEQVEKQVEEEDEVEEEVIIDDHDLSSEDEEDANNATNGDGEDMDATYNDEFDDGY